MTPTPPTTAGASDDGGTAFPVVVEGGDMSGLVSSLSCGMTLRDYFAAAALKGYRATSIPEIAKADSESAARWSYEDADAMIAQRKKIP